MTEKTDRFRVRSARKRSVFCRKGALGETNKHPPRIARVVRLVSLRRLSNFFDSLRGQLVPMLMVSGRVLPPSITIWLPVR